MITTNGKEIIKQFFGGQVGGIGGSIGIGTGTTAAALGDTALAAEVIRIDVVSISADLTNNRIVFKGVLPAGYLPTIYEAGLYHSTVAGTDDDVLVARYVLATPKAVDVDLPTEIEYTLGITV